MQAAEEERAKAQKTGGKGARDRKPPSQGDTSNAPIVKVFPYSQPDLRAKLEVAVQSGSTVLIEGVGHAIDPWMDAILTKQVPIPFCMGPPVLLIIAVVCVRVSECLCLCFCVCMCVADVPLRRPDGHPDL